MLAAIWCAAIVELVCVVLGFYLLPYRNFGAGINIYFLLTFGVRNKSGCVRRRHLYFSAPYLGVRIKSGLACVTHAVAGTYFCP